MRCSAKATSREAAGLLGYRYSVAETVVRGKQLGRTLGYPTANMMLPPTNGAEARHLRRAAPPRRRVAA